MSHANNLGSTIVKLRVLVGFLGEKSQSSWWSSDFLSSNSIAFLAPTFPRSVFLAQYNGVTAAASKVHDELIGVGQTIHLFRLPIELEQSCQDAANNQELVEELQKTLTDRDSVMTRLEAIAIPSTEIHTGPVLVVQGSEDLQNNLKKAAGIYLSAFRGQSKAFPYLKEIM